MLKRYLLPGAQFMGSLLLCVCAEPIAESILRMIGG